MAVLFGRGSTYFWSIIAVTQLYLRPLHGFQFPPSPTSGRRCQLSIPITTIRNPDNKNNNKFDRSILLHNKLWDRLEIEEDEEPFWYLLNCVAGLEIDLLRQCREICQNLPDAIKFVVPTEIKTRSHGANRMVTETKVKYQGYVFAKLRLSPDVYEAIQELDLCRSWMGTVNHKGYKKLPPAPVALNELEVEGFGLEDLEFEEEEEDWVPEGEQKVIVDDEGSDKKDKIDQEAIKAFLGLEVEDMVKVTKRCKFLDEDGIVRRLKDGKILVRFYTYGTMFEEWMEPCDVRKLNEVEVLRGLSGPSQPVTQQDFDGPKDAFESPTGRRHEARSFGGDRNRRQDRVNRGETNRGDRNWKKEEDNWNWYQEQRKGKDDGSFSDDEWTFKPGSAQKDPLSDENAQWGRPPSKRQQSRERKAGRNDRNNDDWSSFVSPASAPAKAKEDDFFASLMSDLSNDLGDSESPSSPASPTASSTDASTEEDDFFASLLMAEEGGGEGGGKQQTKTEDSGVTTSNDVDDFFASLGSSSGDKQQASFDEDDLFSSFDVSGDDDKSDDFFNSLDLGLKSEEGSESSNDFFASLEQELGSTLETEKKQSSPDDDDNDFFASLGDTLSSELDGSTTNEDIQADYDVGKVEGGESKAEVSAASSDSVSSSSANNDVNLSKLTVPKLKELLRERGMKVSGKKAELIERLSA